MPFAAGKKAIAIVMDRSVEILGLAWYIRVKLTTVVGVKSRYLFTGRIKKRL